MSDRPLTVKEAAEYLRVNPGLVRKYISKGLLKAYKLGTSGKHKDSTSPWRIWKADLIDFINQRGQ